MFKRKILSVVVLGLVFLYAVWLGWQKMASPTFVGMVNFPNFQMAAIASSSPGKFIKVVDIPLTELHKLKRMDAVFVFGMGIRLDAEQRAQIQRLADKGVPVNTFFSTNTDNFISNLDSAVAEKLNLYMRYGSTKNYSSLLAFVRSELDGKRFFLSQWEQPFKTPDDFLYHVQEDAYYETLDAYEDYLKKQGLWNSNAKKIALVGGISGGRNRAHILSLIQKLQEEGFVVYPLGGMRKRLEYLQQINPHAVVYMPHGRLAQQHDEAIGWLKQRNIPVFAPLTLMQTEEKWLEDKMGMSGGFMSQSIVMPELDGAILPYALNVQYVDDNGLHLFMAQPERLIRFVDIIKKHLALKDLNNAQKRIAIFYFKGAGMGSLTAAGLEVVPSLFNLLKELKAAGYQVDGLPDNEVDFNKILMTQGMVLGPYAQGGFDDFIKNGNPMLLEVDAYLQWVRESLPEELYLEVETRYGLAPGAYMSLAREQKQCLAIARVQFGNVVLLPQPMPAVGDDSFAMVHGAKVAPPHSYIAPYLWVRHGFDAHAIMHFGTHGSLEFTPGKQMALSHFDWPDALIGTTPHFYYYTISNVGEGIIAKRRAYATLLTYLTPPFMESNLRGQTKELSALLNEWYQLEGEAKSRQALKVKKLSVEMGLHRDLKLDDDLSKVWSEEDMLRIENFAEELSSEKISGQLYVMGRAYEKDKLVSTIVAMWAEPLAFSLAGLDKLAGKISQKDYENKSLFNARYLRPAQKLVSDIIEDRKTVNTALFAELTGLPGHMFVSADQNSSAQPSPFGDPRHESTVSSGHTPRANASPAVGHPHDMTAGAAHSTSGISHPHASSQPANSMHKTENQREVLVYLQQLQTALESIKPAWQWLASSPRLEIEAVLNAFNGGYMAPSPGGDPIANPNTLPTGRNLFAINAEATPGEQAWDMGVKLANATLEAYKKRNNGQYPRKVTFTLWGGEFIQTEGATLAQVLYMLGVEPVRDRMGRISDIRLIPSQELGRPRIDVLVQTSGQLRDIAASRLVLINRAVALAASASNDAFPNFVKMGVTEAERIMVNDGISPAQARELSLSRVFGGLNGMYGTGIMGMVESGDKWEEESQIAQVYLQNMGAMYGSEDNWGVYQKGVFRAMLHNADAVVHPRQSNTWGALSLDHVYEFMGGLNLTIRNVTGKEPEAFFSDYRNRHNVRVQEIKEAIGVEARSTILNPAYIKEKMKGQASSASSIAETIRNTYGFNVMKPQAIDNELWDSYHQVYVKDVHNLNVHQFFEKESPAALQEITAVMMETARKGYWKATDTQLKELAQLHTRLVNEHKPACSGFVCDNMKLRDFIASHAPAPQANQYKKQWDEVRNAPSENVQDGMLMKREQINAARESSQILLNGALVVAVAILVLAGIVFMVRKRRRTEI